MAIGTGKTVQPTVCATEMSFDPYFANGKKPQLCASEALKTRWRAFQRLPHGIQAEEIDEILRRAKEGPLDDWEFYVLSMWE